MNWKPTLVGIFTAYSILRSGEILAKTTFCFCVGVWLFLWSRIDVASCSTTSTSYLRKTWETLPFAILAARSAYAKRVYASSAFALCTAVWLVLSSRSLHSTLPSRDSFLRSLHAQTPTGASAEDTECRICLDERATTRSLPCCGLDLCGDCIARIFGRTPEDWRRNLIQQLFAQEYEDKCPFCRANLFHEKAPWHTLPYKIAICCSVVGLILKVLELTIRVSQFQSAKRIYHSLVIINIVAPALIQCWVLAQACRHISPGELGWWRVLHRDRDRASGLAVHAVDILERDFPSR